MSNRQRACITIHATTRCNRGCSHCSFDSNMRNGTDFDCEKTEKLLKNLETIHLKTNFCLTGGGEPLMNEQLPEIVKMILASPITESLSIVTSGFLDNDAEKDRLEEIIKNNDARKIGICLSFHNHGKNCIKRFLNTLEFLIGIGTRIVDVKVTIGMYDVHLHEKLEKMLEKLSYIPFLIDYRDLMSRGTSRFERQLFDENSFVFLRDSAYLLYCIYANVKRDNLAFVPQKTKLIIVTTQLMKPKGRAEKLPGQAFPYGPPYCPIYFSCNREIDLRVDPDRNVYLFASCDHPPTIIGTVDDEIQEVLRRRKAFKRNALRSLLLDKRMYETKNSLCSLCTKIKAELDALA